MVIRGVDAVVLLAALLLLASCSDNQSEEKSAASAISSARENGTNVCDVECARSAFDACRSAQPSAAKVRRLDSIVCVRGKIDADMRDAFLGQLVSSGDTLVLDSTGGYDAPAVEMALSYFAKDVTAVVGGVCYSACANALFLGARAKVILDGGRVGFHGGAASNAEIASGALNDGASMQVEAEARSINEKTRAFFDLIGVDIATTDSMPLTKEERATMVWSWSRSDYDRFGVKGIIYMPDDTAPAHAK